MTNKSFIDLISRLVSTSDSYWEPVMLTSGLSSVDDKIFSLLKKGYKSGNISVKKAAASGFGYLDSNNKKYRKNGKNFVKQGMKHPISSVRLASAISLGKLALFSTESTKETKKIVQDLYKAINKDDISSTQGIVLSLGLLNNLSEISVKEIPESLDLSIIDPVKFENPIYYIIGLSLYGIANGDIISTINRLHSLVPRITNKTTKRSLALCLAFLIGLIDDYNKMIDQLKLLVESNFEYQSKLGSDTAIVLTYIKIRKMNDKQKLNDFLAMLKGWSDLDSDYEELYSIFKENTPIIDILKTMKSSTDLDIRCASVNCCFFYKEEEFNKFIDYFFNNSSDSLLDNLLLISKSFAYEIQTQDFSRYDFQKFIRSSDSKTKRLSALAYATSQSFLDNDKQIISRINVEKDFDVKYGLLVGLGLKEKVSLITKESDKLVVGDKFFELLLGFLFIDMGIVDIALIFFFSFAITILRKQEQTTDN